MAVLVIVDVMGDEDCGFGGLVVVAWTLKSYIVLELMNFFACAENKSTTRLKTLAR